MRCFSYGCAEEHVRPLRHRGAIAAVRSSEEERQSDDGEDDVVPEHHHIPDAGKREQNREREGNAEFRLTRQVRSDPSALERADDPAEKHQNVRRPRERCCHRLHCCRIVPIKVFREREEE